MIYTVVIYENSRYMDGSEPYPLGEFETCDDALAAAKRAVDDDLDESYTPGMAAGELYLQYITFGRDPRIDSSDDSCYFSGWNYARERSAAICDGKRSASPQPRIDWFRVTFDETSIYLDVSPPSRDPWQARIEWARVIRICFKSGDLFSSDDIYIFTDERPESRVIPTEAAGGPDLWNEIIRRGLFDAELAIRAASSIDRLFCCPQNKR
jgi:hypothetical protein